MASFDENGKYIKTNWKAGDKITATKLNKIEESIEAVNDNDISRHVEADARLDALEAKDVAHDKELTNIKNTIADNKAAAELGDYEINSRMTFIENELNEGIEEVHNVAETVDGKIAQAEANMTAQVNTAKDEMTAQVDQGKADMEAMVAEVEADLEGLHAKDDELAEQVAQNVNNLNNISIFPEMFGAKGDGIADDTEALQLSIDSANKVVDLNGKTYICTKLILKNNICIRNGILKSDNSDSILKGEYVNNITLEDLKLDGLDTSEKGISIWDGKNIHINNVEITNFTTISEVTAGIELRRCSFSKINNCEISNVTAKVDGTIGNGYGASRGMYIDRCSNIHIDSCNIYNIISTDDGDGIHIIGDFLYDDYYNYQITISNNIIKDCTRRLIKIQQPGVIIKGNKLSTSEGFVSQNLINIYDSNVMVIENNIKAECDLIIGIGNSGVDTISNIIISNNYMEYTGVNYQGCILLSGSDVIKNVNIVNNTLIGTDTLNEQGIYIRAYFENLCVSNNKMSLVQNAIYIRDVSEQIEGMFSKGLIVCQNDCTVRYNLLYGSSDNITTDLVVCDNIVEITEPLSYAQNTVRLNEAYYNYYPIIQNNKVNDGFADGLKKYGTTDQRPACGIKIGYSYFDTTLNKNIVWNGTNWVDATGTVV